MVADHLSRLVIAHNSYSLPINDDFPEESLMFLVKTPWYAHIANYLVTGEIPSEWLRDCPTPYCDLWQPYFRLRLFSHF